jgi:tetratricopeptide (TPR) repeat protein
MKKLKENTLYYDSKCKLCTRFSFFLEKHFKINATSAWDNEYSKSKMLGEHTWLYIDINLKEFLRSQALISIFKTNKKTKFLYTLLNNKPCIFLGDIFYKIVERSRKHFNQKLLKLLFISVFLMFITTLFFYRQNILFSLGNRFFGGKVFNTTLYDIDMAQTFFELADDSDGKNVMWLNYQLSRIHFIRGELDTAVAYANKELETHPTNCRTHYIRGLAYAYMDKDKELNKAVSDFEEFNKCFPLTWAGHNDLAWFWFRKGNMEKVINVAEQVTPLYPNNPWIQNTYGTALINVGRYAEAKKALLAAKETADNMTEDMWGAAYPGNNPSIYGKGLSAMRKSIDDNLKIANEKMGIKIINN